MDYPVEWRRRQRDCPIKSGNDRKGKMSNNDRERRMSGNDINSVMTEKGECRVITVRESSRIMTVYCVVILSSDCRAKSESPGGFGDFSGDRH